MNSFFSKLALAALLLAPTQAHAIMTPQKYCESLAATSCEVLNIEGPTSSAASTIGNFGTAYSPYIAHVRDYSQSSIITGVIKYCRNRVLKFQIFYGSSSQTGTTGQIWYNVSASGAGSNYPTTGIPALNLPTTLSGAGSISLASSAGALNNTTLCTQLP